MPEVSWGCGRCNAVLGLRLKRGLALRAVRSSDVASRSVPEGVEIVAVGLRESANSCRA
jgi:hypothetical protein